MGKHSTLVRTTVKCFLHFISLFFRMPGTVTRTVIGSSIPRFQYVNTFQGRKQISFH